MHSTLAEEKYNEIFALLRQTGLEVINKRVESDFWIQTKEDGSLVTSVDYWANEVLISKLKSLFPNDVIIGEESSDKSYPTHAPRIWYVDPIDGTKAFTKGEDHFYILIGLAIEGIPTIGFCYKPIEDLLIYNTEKEVIIIQSGNRISIPSLSWNSSQTLVQKHFTKSQQFEILDFFLKTKEHYIHDMVSLLGPLFGKSIGYLGLRRTFYWDLCAPAAIMRKAGHVQEFFHFEGKPALLNDGSIKCRSHYSLPNDAPSKLIDWFKNEASILTEE